MSDETWNQVLSASRKLVEYLEANGAKSDSILVIAQTRLIEQRVHRG